MDVFFLVQMASDGGTVLQTSWQQGCMLHMTASNAELRAKCVDPASEMLRTVLLFFKTFNTSGRAKMGYSRDAWTVV